MPKRVQWFWDETTRRYRYASGRVVPERYVKTDVWRVAHAQRAAFRELTISLRNGTINLQQWYDEMRAGMKASYRSTYMIATGNSGKMTPSERGRFGFLMRQQYVFLNNFAAGLADGSIKLNGRAVFRAGMYGDAAASLYENARHRMRRAQGFEEGRRILGVAEHCPDCVEYAGRGWVPIAEVPPIGDSVCRTHCHCTIEVRAFAPDTGVEAIEDLE